MKSKKTPEKLTEIPLATIYLDRIRQGRMTVQDIRRRLATAVRMRKSWLKIKTPYAKEQAQMMEHHIATYERVIELGTKLKVVKAVH